jgi:DNA-binding transcriptional ArsR family regulator
VPSVRLRTKELNALGEAAECAKTLAHPGRLRMVQILLQREYTVSDLAEACKLPSALASEHLRLMQRCGSLTRKKEERKVCYRFFGTHLKNILKCVEDRFGVANASR